MFNVAQFPPSLNGLSFAPREVGDESGGNGEARLRVGQEQLRASGRTLEREVLGEGDVGVAVGGSGSACVADLEGNPAAIVPTSSPKPGYGDGRHG